MALPVLPIGAPPNQPLYIRAHTWPVKRSPKYSTLKHWGSGGGRSTVPLYANNCLWTFEFTYDVIFNNPSKLNPVYSPVVPPTDLAILDAFFHAQLGSGSEFVYCPPDSNVQNQTLANADANNNVELIHTIGKYPTVPFTGSPVFNTVNESVQDVNGTTINVTANGVSASGNVTVLAANTVAPYEGIVLHFSSTPIPPIVASFTYYYRCAFADDYLEYEDFVYLLTALKSLKIEQVRVLG